MTDPEFQFYDIHATMVVERPNRDGIIVLYEEGVSPPVCDFCMDTRIRWEYDCETFVIGAFGSDDGWYACDRCSALVEANEPEMLAQRSLQSWRLRGMPALPDLGEGLRVMQSGFFAHRQGERRAFG